MKKRGNLRLMKKGIDIELSLEELERDYWKNLDFYPSKLVERCYRFRKIPLKDLTIEQLRTLISQQIGLDFLIPIACEHLEKNILAEGDFYEGDLLESLLSIEKAYWLSHWDLYKSLKIIMQESLHEIEGTNLSGSVTVFLNFK